MRLSLRKNQRIVVSKLKNHGRISDIRKKEKLWKEKQYHTTDNGRYRKCKSLFGNFFIHFNFSLRMF